MSRSEFMMTAEEIRLKRSKRRRVIIIAIAIVVVLVTGFFTARPALNAVKARQAGRHAAKAFAYIDNANWLGARKEASAAYQLRPTEPQSVRAVARFLSRTRQPDALEFWQQLEKLTPLTREDRQDEAAIAIISGETSRAETAVQALLESKGADPIGWLLAAQLAIQKRASCRNSSRRTRLPKRRRNYSRSIYSNTRMLRAVTSSSPKASRNLRTATPPICSRWPPG